MRLHKIGLFFVKIAIHMDEDKKIPYIHGTPSPLKPSLFELDVNEIERVNELVSKIDKLDLEHNNPFRVACERFSRSFEERRDDDRIIDLAFAFEALFTDKDTSKIAYMGKFVGIGCSMLLGKTPKERDEINQFLIETFNLRNKIVHSNEVSPTIKVNDKVYAIKDIPTQLQKYLRDSIKQLM